MKSRYRIIVKKDGTESVIIEYLDALGLIDIASAKLKKLVNGEITNFTAEEMSEAG